MQIIQQQREQIILFSAHRESYLPTKAEAPTPRATKSSLNEYCTKTHIKKTANRQWERISLFQEITHFGNACIPYSPIHSK